MNNAYMNNIELYEKDEETAYNAGFDILQYKKVTLSDIINMDNKLTSVSVCGLITEVESRVNKNNDTYTRGVIQAKNEKVVFTQFGMTAEKFISAYKLDKLPMLVRLYCDEIKVYNNYPMIQQIKDIRRLKSSIDDYIYVSEYPVDFMYKSITSYIKGMKIPELKAVCEAVMDRYKEKMAYYPLSATVHTEKGGYLQHIYNCVSEVVTSRSGPKVKGTLKDNNPVKIINTEILVTSFLSYLIGSFHKYDIDIKTGAIIKDNNSVNVTDRSIFEFCKIAEDKVKDGLDNPYIKTVLSCISNSPCRDRFGNNTGNTIESIKFYYVSKMEIAENIAINAGYYALTDIDSPITVSIMDKQISLIKYF